MQKTDFTAIAIDEASDAIGASISESFMTMTEGQPVNIVDGLLAIAEGLNSVASAIRKLGNGNANTDMGAIEGLSVILKDGLENISRNIWESRQQ